VNFTIEDILAERECDCRCDPSKQERDCAIEDADEYFEQEYTLFGNLIIEQLDDIGKVPLHCLEQENANPRVD